MKRFSQQFKKQADTIRMRAAERSALKDRLVTYMEYHPLPAAREQKVRRASVHNGASLVSEQFRLIRVQAAWLRGFAAFAAVLVFIVIPVAAEQSVPGDVLYPVKTQITEPLRGQLAFTPYAKIQWDTTQVERRVAEARQLASQGKLTPQTEASVAAAVQDHASAAQQEIATLRKSNADDAAIAEISLASALAVQSQVLDMSSTSSSTDGHSIALLAGTVTQVQKTVEAGQASTTPSYDKLLSQVQLQTTNAYNLFDSIKDQISATQTAEIERRLNDVQRETAEAITLHGGTTTAASSTMAAIASVASSTASSSVATTTEMFKGTKSSSTPLLSATTTGATSMATDTQAVRVLRGTLADVLKLINYMTNIDVRAHVSINSLIPVTLTDAERIGTIEKSLDVAGAVMLDVATFPKTDPAHAKLEEGSTTLAAHIIAATTALNNHDLDSAEAAASAAQTLAHDMATLMHRTDGTSDQTKSTTTASSTPMVPVVASSTTQS